MPNRDVARFALELEPHLDKLYRAAYRLTRHRADASELVQETCIRAFVGRDKWLETESRLGWLMRIQYNLFIDIARRRRREKTVLLDDAGVARLPGDARFEPEHCAEQDERLALLERVWPRLGPDQQVVLALRCEGYSLAQMQEITGFGSDVLNMRLHRARQRLARLLEQEEAAGTPITREVLS